MFCFLLPNVLVTVTSTASRPGAAVLYPVGKSAPQVGILSCEMAALPVWDLGPQRDWVPTQPLNTELGGEQLHLLLLQQLPCYLPRQQLHLLWLRTPAGRPQGGHPSPCVLQEAHTRQPQAGSKWAADTRGSICSRPLAPEGASLQPEKR